MALSQHGISLLTLHREAGRRIMRPQGKFDEIQQPYAIDSSRLAQTLEQALYDIAPHPLFPNMFLINLEAVDEGLSLTRFQATYQGLLTGTSKAPRLQVRRTGSTTDFTNSGTVVTGRTADVSGFLSIDYVTTQEPTADLFQQVFNAVQLGITAPEDHTFVLQSQDFTQVANFYEVTQQYSRIQFVGDLA